MFADEIVADLTFKRTDAGSVDIAGHIDTLLQYGRNSDTITEFGVRRGTSTSCWLIADPKKLTCYDIIPNCLPAKTKVMFEGFARENGIDFQLVCGDSRVVEIEETDLLFIDTHHTYEQLTTELNRHGDKAKKYIICHDTVYDAGCLKAIEDYIERNPHWRIKEHFKHNNGLTVMERINHVSALEICERETDMEKQEAISVLQDYVLGDLKGKGHLQKARSAALVLPPSHNRTLVMQDIDRQIGGQKTAKDLQVSVNAAFVNLIGAVPRAQNRAEPDPDHDLPDFNGMSYSELQSMLKEADLPANGSKEELIERLTKPVEPADSQE